MRREKQETERKNKERKRNIIPYFFNWKEISDFPKNPFIAKHTL